MRKTHPAFRLRTSVCGMMHVRFSPMSSAADDCVSTLVLAAVTQTDGDSRADTGTEGGTATHALKDIMCRLWEKSACEACWGGGGRMANQIHPA